MLHHLRLALDEARHVPRTIRLIQAATGRWTAFWLALLFVQGLLPAFGVYLTRSVVDTLLAAIGTDTGWARLGPVLAPAILLGFVIIALALTRAAAGWVRLQQAELLRDYISHRIHEQSIAVGMAFYDFPEFYDHLHRAREEAAYRPAALLEVAGSLLQNAVTLVAVAAVLAPYGVWLPIVLVLGNVPSLVLVLGNALRRQEWRIRAAPHQRRGWYYDSILTTREAAAEVRVFGLGGHFMEAYQTLRARLRGEQLQLVRREAAGELLAGLLGLTATVLAAAWVLSQAMRGHLTAGALAMFYAAFVQGQGLMRSTLQHAGELYLNSLFLGNLFAFLALEPEARPTPPQRPHVSRHARAVTFDSVDFQYPGMTRPALSDFSLDVRPGQTIAIVGPNGAGKSTVIKLLCRFYDPQGGRILIDGIDIRDRAPVEIRRLISVLFQNPVRFAASVHDSIALGDVAGTPSQRRIAAAAHAAGADDFVSRLPHRHETLLGKQFERGVELSGGEWQRIALARALVRPAPLLLLDEPTSAMDSWAEADWFDRLRAETAGRTTVIITHRFTTAMRADVIHVMEQGRIVESGTHNQLLARDGKYASSWARQQGYQPLADMVERSVYERNSSVAS